jgi:hypothetical protein
MGALSARETSHDLEDRIVALQEDRQGLASRAKFSCNRALVIKPIKSNS